MELKSRSVDEKTCIISAVGRLNAASAAILKDEMKAQVASGHSFLVIDLKETAFVDSSGLSALVSGLKLTREQGGTLSLSGLNEQTSTVLKLTLLDRIFQIYPDVDHALKKQGT